ncbi:uncharacterized protein LOC130563505 [Triplophysa rosa]|uniref:uncharacterized protein LOC130563505 n=1 Tax=Triplophysa rosa TaxID=992332 RepID=UPI002545DEAB|nr:uncharacterized protein LOC130563505 [Triplophysa rosa]XP_057205057.1 uncharacterized protein LOC130563505 [Triplophysa rosa]
MAQSTATIKQITETTSPTMLSQSTTQLWSTATTTRLSTKIQLPSTTALQPITTPRTTTVTTTMTTTTITPIPTPALPKVAVGFVLLTQFVQELENQQSEQFKTLSAEVKKGCDVVYKKKFGARFLRTEVLAFRRDDGTRAAGHVRAEIELVFDGSSTGPLPAVTEVVETLKDAASNPASGLNLTIDATSISVIRALQTIPVSILTDGTFVVALSNSSSPAYRNRASMIKTGLEPFFTDDYPTSFTVLSITNFSDVSTKSVSRATIQNSMDLTFAANSPLPNANQIVNTIVRAANSSSLPFKIFTHSITVSGTEYSSAEVSSHISMLMASVLIAMSLLVTRFD